MPITPGTLLLKILRKKACQPFRMKSADKQLLKKIKKGDVKSFEMLFRDYYEELCHYANRYLKDLDLAEEAVQDIFFSIWKNRESLQIKQSVKSYLYIATRNKCLKTIRSQNMAAQYSDYVKNAPHEQVTTPVDELNAKELNLLIERTLNQLPERMGKVFRMNRFQGLKYTEIADQLSISVKTVEANMGKALKIFRKNLDEFLRVI
ncbi:MAG: RNA polymerase sigma-70 factor [Bacteroidales bacterium]